MLTPQFGRLKEKASNNNMFMTDEKVAEEAAKYFLSNGLTFKGLAQCAFVVAGGGLSISASFDPGRICFGVLSTEVGVEAGMTGASLVVLVAVRGPSSVTSSLGLLTIPQPVLINCLTGRRWTGNVKATAFIGIGAEISINKDEGTKTKTTMEDEEEDLSSKLELASIGCKAEVKVGAQAEVGYTYENLYAEDVCPLSFSDVTSAREKLADIIAVGSYKALQKTIACDFTKKHRAYFDEISYEGYFFGHNSSVDICKVLSKGCGHRNIPLPLKQEAESLISHLRTWADKDTPPPRHTTSIRICSHKGDGKAGLVATAGVSADILGGGVKAQATAEALTLSGNYKSATMRHQTVYPAPHNGLEKSYLIMTQDSEVIYKQVSFVGLQLTAELSANILGNDVADLLKVDKKKRPKIGGEDNEIKAFEVDIVNNSMTYTAINVLWHVSSTTVLTPQKKSTSPLMHGLSHLNNTMQKALPSSGVSFGGSFEIHNLKRFMAGEQNDYFNGVAESLNISLDELTVFFDALDNENGGPGGAFIFLGGLATGHKIKAVLLEASFACNVDTSIEVVKSVNGKKELIELSANTAKEWLKLPKVQRKLQAIRLRYRMQDTHDGDHEFGLGFKIAGQGLGIKLKSVDQAGSEGIVDLFTHWVDSTIAHSIDPTKAYDNEKSVPPVTLFCQ